MNNATFQRHEVKYLVTEQQRRFVIRAMEDRMRPDEHGESTICNVYYDTPDFRLIRASLEKPVYREKLRLRSYGPALPEQEVYLELKKKCRDVIYKRRISLPEREAADFLRGQAPAPACQIGREVAYVLQFYGNLNPSVYLSYDRTAYFARDDGDLRVTFDRDIRWRADGLTLTDGPGGEQILPPDQTLLEIKTGGALPMWLVELLREGEIRRTPFSKYGMAYGALLARQGGELRGVICA